MAYFKKKQMKANGKWYPVAVTIGRPVGTDVIAKKLADLSSLSTGDVKSVLDLLGGVLGDYMNQGRSVKLDGVGTFYYTANTEGKGVDTEKEVGAQQARACASSPKCHAAAAAKSLPAASWPQTPSGNCWTMKSPHTPCPTTKKKKLPEQAAPSRARTAARAPRKTR